jgi:hypothetical protein
LLSDLIMHTDLPRSVDADTLTYDDVDALRGIVARILKSAPRATLSQIETELRRIGFDFHGKSLEALLRRTR